MEGQSSDCKVSDSDRISTSTDDFSTISTSTDDVSTISTSTDDVRTISTSTDDVSIFPSFMQAFEELLAAVKKATTLTTSFKSILENLKLLLVTIQPAIKDLVCHDIMKDALPRLKKLIKVMKEGSTLVRKCSKVAQFNLFKRYRYAKKLQRLDDEILRFFQTYLPLATSMEVKGTLKAVRGMKNLMRRHSLLLFKGTFKRTLAFKYSGVPAVPDFVVGLDIPLRSVKERLLQGGFSVTVVTGPAGCGKSTLVKKLCHDADIEGKFKENIFYMSVSRFPNLMMIVQRLLYHAASDVPDIQTEAEAVDQLQQLLVKLGKNPILLVLDDIWSESESLLEKLVCCKDLDYKVLVTSRFEFPSFGPAYKLDHLSHQDARELFLHCAVLQEPFPADDLIDKVVMHCKGSPLALTVMGKSFSGKPLPVWESNLQKLSEGLSIVDTNSDILACFQRSIDDLENMAIYEGCFMDLGAFPADHIIPITVLIDMWAELYNLDSGGVQAMSILHELSSRSLADLVFTRKDPSEGDGFYNDVFLMQHDLLRELAIHLISQMPVEQRERLCLEIRGDKFPDWISQPLGPLKARLLSISTDENFSSNWPEMELPAIEVLILHFKAKNFSLPLCMKQMDTLKALVVSNNTLFPAELENLHLDSLPNLKRLRLERLKVPFSHIPWESLKTLEKASFFMCNINPDPPTSVKTRELPNLVELDISYCNELDKLPAAICEIPSLRKLCITNCHNLSEIPEEIGNLSNLEVLRLNRCTSLSALPESIGRLQELSFLDLSNCVFIKKLPDQMGELSKLKELHIEGCLNLSAMPSSFGRLEHMKYLVCDAERSVLWRSLKQDLPKLIIKVVGEDVNLNWVRIR